MMTAKFRKDIFVLIGLSVALIGVYGCSKKEEGGGTSSGPVATNTPDSSKPADPGTSTEAPPTNTAPDSTKPAPPKVKTAEEMAAEMAKRAPKLTDEQRQAAIKKVENQAAKSTNVSLAQIGMIAYPGTKPVGAEKTDVGRTVYFYNMMTKDKYDKVLAYYRPHLKDVKEKSDGSPFSISGTSEKGIQLMVTARPWQDGSLTLIVITASKPK